MGHYRSIFVSDLHLGARACQAEVFSGFLKKNTADNLFLVGDGPYLDMLKSRYPNVEFIGKKTGSDLAYYYQTADVFMFPSKADTFGVVMIESIACGTPVAAYPVTGPIDVVKPGINGELSENLASAVSEAFAISHKSVYNSSLKWTWERCYAQFKENLLDR